MSWLCGMHTSFFCSVCNIDLSKKSLRYDLWCLMNPVAIVNNTLYIQKISTEKISRIFNIQSICSMYNHVVCKVVHTCRSDYNWKPQLQCITIVYAALYVYWFKEVDFIMLIYSLNNFSKRVVVLSIHQYYNYTECLRLLIIHQKLHRMCFTSPYTQLPIEN